MISKYFKIHELVPQSLYKLKREQAWRYVAQTLIVSLDTIKERFPKGTLTVNNYAWGGEREWSGLRTPDSPYYSPTSMHSFMQALDFKASHYSSEEIRQDIINNPAVYPFIRGLELGVSWVHFDVRNEDQLVTFGAV